MNSVQAIESQKACIPCDSSTVLSFVLILFPVVTPGCASWHHRQEPTTQEQSTKSPLSVDSKPSVDTVTLETVLVRFDELSQPALENAWQSADETILALDRRRELDANGIRVGVIRGELPSTIRTQLSNAQQRLQQDVVEQIGLGADSDLHSRTLICRAGRRKELIVRRELTHRLFVFTTTGGTISGDPFDKATAVLAMTVVPQPDEAALVELIPEVQYGEPRNVYVSSDFGIRQETKRDAKVWKHLKIRAPLTRGDTLMISATRPTKALGHAFFVTETSMQTEEQTLLLIRLTEAHLDELFQAAIAPPSPAVMESR